MSGTAAKWWWVRHAPVAWAGVRIYGQTDLACDVSDTAAFAVLAAQLPPGAVTVRSHLSRTLNTAMAIATAGYALSPPLVEPTLAEQAFGEWEGATWDDLDAAGGDHLAAFWRDPFAVAPPGGESFLDVVARVAATVSRLSQAYAGRDIVAVTHAGTIRAALSLALDLSPSAAHAIAIDPLSLTRITVNNGIFNVLAVNLPSSSSTKKRKSEMP